MIVLDIIRNLQMPDSGQERKRGRVHNVWEPETNIKDTGWQFATTSALWQMVL